MLLALILACGGAPEPVPEAAPVPVQAAPVAEPTPAPVEAPPIAEPVASPTAAPAIGPPEGYQACKDEWRAGGCTREHRDTCGIGADGSTQTYPNPCVACERGVSGWKDGACP